MYNIVESGKRLKKLRMEKGKTQSEIADALSISLETVSKIERGNRGMSVDLLSAFSDYFNVSMDYIAKGNGIQDKAETILEVNSLLERVPHEYEEVVKKMMIGMLRQLEV